MSKEAKTLALLGSILIVVALGFVWMNREERLGPDGGSVETSGGAGGTRQDISRADLLSREDSISLLSQGSNVTLVEFLDLECEVCGMMYPTVERVLAEYQGRMNYVVRYFPLHRNSVLATKSAEAAGRQGKYWDMFAKLFEGQKEWGEKTQPQTEVFLRYANELGLDLQAFQRDLADPLIETKINRDKDDALTLGVRGTPTFYLNGNLIGNMLSYEQLKSKIEAELKQ